MPEPREWTISVCPRCDGIWGKGAPMCECLPAFIVESNMIEGIVRRPTNGEIVAHERLLALAIVTVADLEEFVACVAGVPLRRGLGQDVRIAGHRPPPGGPGIERDLASILSAGWGPYDTHVAYELLHPFMDGNGRSGRALWAWQMQRVGCLPFRLPFLHTWYYQALNSWDGQGDPPGGWTRKITRGGRS